MNTSTNLFETIKRDGISNQLSDGHERCIQISQMDIECVRSFEF